MFLFFGTNSTANKVIGIIIDRIAGKTRSDIREVYVISKGVDEFRSHLSNAIQTHLDYDTYKSLSEQSKAKVRESIAYGLMELSRALVDRFGDQGITYTWKPEYNDEQLVSVTNTISFGSFLNDPKNHPAIENKLEEINELMREGENMTRTCERLVTCNKFL